MIKISFPGELQNTQPLYTPPMGKIKVSIDEIYMTFVSAMELNGIYKTEFALTIVGYGYQQQLNSLTIDMGSLREVVLNKIHPFDRKYMELSQLTPIKAVFLFDFDEWFEDATRLVKPKITNIPFIANFQFKIQPPFMIQYDILRITFSRFLEKKFEKFITKKSYEKKWYDVFIPKLAMDFVRKRISGVFEYGYNFQSNSMRIKMKDIYILLAVYGLNKLFQLNKKKDPLLVKIDKDTQFSQFVKKNLPKVKTGRWKKLFD